jgi:hypothetical protein
MLKPATSVRLEEDGKLADRESPETPAPAKQPAIKGDELDALVQAHQKQKWDAETRKIARLRALRLARDAQPAKKATKPRVQARDRPIKRKARPSKYLGGYE